MWPILPLTENQAYIVGAQALCILNEMYTISDCNSALLLTTHLCKHIFHIDINGYLMCSNIYQTIVHRLPLEIEFPDLYIYIFILLVYYYIILILYINNALRFD